MPLWCKGISSVIPAKTTSITIVQLDLNQFNNSAEYDQMVNLACCYALFKFVQNFGTWLYSQPHSKRKSKGIVFVWPSHTCSIGSHDKPPSLMFLLESEPSFNSKNSNSFCCVAFSTRPFLIEIDMLGRVALVFACRTLSLIFLLKNGPYFNSKNSNSFCRVTFPTRSYLIRHWHVWLGRSRAGKLLLIFLLEGELPINSKNSSSFCSYDLPNSIECMAGFARVWNHIAHFFARILSSKNS
jgi:hypothetical protein